MKLDLDAMEAAARLHVEPVAWMVYSVDGQSARITDNPAELAEGERSLPLYTEPVYSDEDVIALCRIARAAQALADEGQEYAFDDIGLGRGAPNSYWEDLDDALDPDDAALKEDGK